MLAVRRKPLGEVYDLLQRCGYPLLPSRELALSMMRQCNHITLCDGSTLAVWIGVHGNSREVALDFCVAPEYRKRWCTPSIYRGLLEGLFAKGVEVIKVETSNPAMVKAAIKAGFKMDASLQSSPITLKLTHKDYLGKLAMRGKSL